MVGLAVIASSCTVNELTNETELPEGTLVRLSFSSDPSAAPQSEATRASWEDSKGSGNLTFRWEKVDIDSEESDEQVLIVTDGEKPVSVKVTSNEEPVSYSGLSVTPRESDAHFANFQTVGYYSTDDLKKAKYCFAVTGAPVITEDTSNGRHICELPDMPSVFEQTTNQDPSFLRDYMYMYATTAYSGNGNTLAFRHIPATFRFIISNATDNPMQIDEIYMNVASGGPLASKTSAVTFDWSEGTSSLSFGEDAYDMVSVSPGAGAIVATGERYTAYAMALPLADNDAFKGKTVNFMIKNNGVEQIVFQLSGERLAKINGSDICNWIGGKSYTLRINIGAEDKITGYIMEDKAIEVNSNIDETYTLKYEDLNGNPLEGYADICTLSVDEVAYYTDFINVNVAPRGTETIGIYDSEGTRQGTILISNLKPDYSEEHMYSFGLLSDVHIGYSGIDAEADFRRALGFFQAEGVELTCICGDITQNGLESELQIYEQTIMEFAAANVFTTTGNHDCVEGLSKGIDPELWTKYTHMPMVYEHAVERNGRVDHFLFLGMSYWYNGFSSAYLDYHINWLENMLEEYRNERCFVITHLFFPERSGNLLEIYPQANWLSGKQLARLQDLCDRYVNSIWFSGHSHWQWELQKYEDRANIYRTYNGADPTSGWCVHVPSCGFPITSDGVKDNNGGDRVGVAAGSEGAFVQVYENHIDIIGRDFISGKYLPIATYRLDTTLKEVDEDDTPLENHYLKAEDFVRYKGDESKMHIANVDGNYVDVIFEAPSQGYYVTNDTFYYGVSDAAYLNVEKILCWTNWDEKNQSGDLVPTIENVGFYAGTYHLSSTNSCYVNPLKGVQFQTSSSSDLSLYPIKIRMRAEMTFSPEYDGGDGNEHVAHYLKAKDFIKNPGKLGGSFEVYDSQDTDYVEVEFNKPGQGFYVRNDTFIYGVSTGDGQKVSVVVEDVIAYKKVGETWTEFPEEELSYVGFYNGSYLLKTTRDLYVNAAQGLQFQTSSKFTLGSIKLKMKIHIVFYTDSPSINKISDKYYIQASDFIFAQYEGSQDETLAEGKMTVKDIGNNKVEIIIPAHSSGWYINPTARGLALAIGASIKVYDLDIWVGNDEEPVPTLSNIGFKDSALGLYFLDSREASCNNKVGIEFQSGDAYEGPYPVKIQMKASAIYY